MSIETNSGMSAESPRHPTNSPQEDSVFGHEAVERLSDDLAIPTEAPTLDGLSSPLDDIDPITGAPRATRAPRQEAVAAPCQPFASDSAFSSSSALSALSTASSLSAPSPSEAADFTLSDDAWRSSSAEPMEVPAGAPEAVEVEALPSSDPASPAAGQNDPAPSNADTAAAYHDQPTDTADTAAARIDETTHKAADVVGNAPASEATRADRPAPAAEAAPQRRATRRSQPREDLHSTQERRMAFFQEQIISEGSPVEASADSFAGGTVSEMATSAGDAAAIGEPAPGSATTPTDHGTATPSTDRGDAPVSPADTVAMATPSPSAASASSAGAPTTATGAAAAGGVAAANAASSTTSSAVASPASAASKATLSNASTSEPTPISTEGDVLLDGSTVVGKPASRAGAHWASLLLTLVFAPIAWFFLNDAARELIATHEPFSLGVNMRGLLFLGAGLLTLTITMSLARRSSLGAWAAGIVTLAVGITPLAVPTIVESALTPFLSTLSAQSSIGAVIAEALWTDAITGRLATYGVLLILLAVVSHSARRAGRREQEVIDRIRKSAR